MIRVALLGRGVGRSLSPVIHGQGALRHGLELCYETRECDAASLAGELARARREGLAGLNLTAPLKQAVIPHLARLDAGARRAGSVNLLLPHPEGWRGLSTDGPGFLDPLDRRALVPGRVILLGAGGAARAVAHALRERWPALELELRARRPQAARELADSLPGPPATVASPGDPIPCATDLLVQATSLGMAGGSPWPADLRLPGLERVHTVYELVSVPARTSLIRQAEEAGCATIAGVEMLVAQAGPAFEHWTGRVLPGRALRRICRLRLALEGQLDKPLVLVGFMGSGKSTLAPLLGQALDLPWRDLDRDLEHQTGASIAQLMARGEPAFRALERQLFDRALMEKPCPVIASGGGLAAQPGFFGEYATRAYFVALDGEPELLAARVTADPHRAVRPLLAGASGGELAARMATLLAARRPAYLQAPIRLELLPGEGPLATLDRLLETLEPALLERVC